MIGEINLVMTAIVEREVLKSWRRSVTEKSAEDGRFVAQYLKSVCTLDVWLCCFFNIFLTLSLKPGTVRKLLSFYATLLR